MVDAILCDMRMPKMNKRVETLAFFKLQFPSVPVIVMTGQPDLKGRPTSWSRCGKPVRPEKLTEVVRKHAKGHV